MSFQCSPPSSERYRPPSLASIRVYTRCPSGGATATPILPQSPWGRPFAVVLLPVAAASRRPDRAAPGPAADERPGVAARLPQAGEQDARVGRVEADVGGARVGVLGQHLLPDLAAVGGAVDAAL